MDPQAVPPQAPPAPKYPLVPFLLALLFFLISLFLAYQNMQLQKQITQLSIQSSPTPIVQRQPSAETNIANWKTYTVSGSQASFMYPTSLSYLKFENGVVGFFDDSNKLENCKNDMRQQVRRIDTPCLDHKFSFNDFKIYTQSEYENYQKQNSLLYPKTFIDLAGRVWQTDLVLGEAYNFSATTKTNNKYYNVFFQSLEPSFGDKTRDFFDQILSTFKFVSQ